MGATPPDDGAEPRLRAVRRPLRHDWSMALDVDLRPDELVPDRPFTDPTHSLREADVMREMRVRQRAIARSWTPADGPSRYGAVDEYEGDGRRHWLAVPDKRALLGATDLTVVGFFGQARANTDHSILFDLEEEVIAGLAAHAGLLSYYDMELTEGRFGNLILFSTFDLPESWHADAAHARAVEIAPRHFDSIRLHRGWICGPLLGDGDLTLERTKYFAFEGDAMWRAERRFTERRPAAGTAGLPSTSSLADA